MASYKALSAASVMHPMYDLYTDTDFALTGTASTTPMDGVVLTDGMYVVIDYASKFGVYSCAVNADAYTLTLVTDLGTTATNNIPYLFEISQGTHAGLWDYTNINSTPKFSSSPQIITETLSISGTSINSAQAYNQVITYAKTYSAIYSVNISIKSTTNDHPVLIDFSNIVYNTESLTGQTRRLVNLGSQVAENYSIEVNVIGR